MDWIVLSPHLDDAALSLGGFILGQAGRGRRVLVATVYTREPDSARLPRRLRGLTPVAERKAEDRAALARLGAELAWLDLPERIFREPWLGGPLGVFRGPERPALEGFTQLGPIQAAISELAARHPGARLLVPLGVGNHADHVEVLLAGLGWARASRALGRVAFYEDAYAIMTRARQRHFLARARCWPEAEAPERVRPEIRRLARVMTGAMRGLGPEALVEGLGAEGWRLEPAPLGDRLPGKLEAIGCYRSQLALLAGLDAWGEVLGRYHGFFGQAEPIWIPPGGAEVGEQAPGRTPPVPL